MPDIDVKPVPSDVFMYYNANNSYTDFILNLCTVLHPHFSVCVKKREGKKRVNASVSRSLST